MQGSLKVKGGYYVADGGSENFILGSNINLSYAYDNMHLFPKVAPISYTVNENILSGRIISPIVFNPSDPTFGAVLVIPLSSTFTNDVWPGLALGDRILFNFSNTTSSTMLGSYDPFEVNGIYQCLGVQIHNSTVQNFKTIPFCFKTLLLVYLH